MRGSSGAAGGSSVLSGLRMLVGGEALNGPLSQAMARHGGSVSNLYGPTETTIWSAAMRLEGNADGAAPDGSARSGEIDAVSLRVVDASCLPLRLVVRFGTREFMSWTAVCRLFLLVLLASFTLRGRALRGVIWGGLV